MKKFKAFGLLVVVLALSLAFIACGGGAGGGSGPGDGGGSNTTSGFGGGKGGGGGGQSGVHEESPYWNAGMIKGQYLTDINIAFALIDDDDQHTIYIPELRPLDDGTPMFSNLWQEVAKLKRKFPNLKVNISVGGWGAENFSDMANDNELRELFVAGVCEWLELYDLDGVDIDWEYPVGPEWGSDIIVRPEDADNYISLLQDLRDAMDELGGTTGKRYGLTTAVPASDWFMDPDVGNIDVVAVANIVDALKLMSYDYYGGWSDQTGHLANIYNNPEDPDWGGWSTDQAVEAYLDAGVPPEKIQMGFAFYGRAFIGVSPGPNGDGLFQEFEDVPFVEGEVTRAQIEEFLKPGSGFTRYWDEVAMAPYLYNGDMWITYSDEQQIEELVTYSKDKGLGGFFSWEHGSDMKGTLLKVLYNKAGSGAVVSTYIRTWPLDD